MTVGATIRLSVLVIGIIIMGDRPILSTYNGDTQKLMSSDETNKLTLVNGASTLIADYGIRVTTELPVPPQLSVTQEKPNALECPFTVRAIISAEAKSDDFAIITFNNNSRVVHVGDILKINKNSFNILAIEPKALSAKVNEQIVHCYFK
ncbi:MAG: hypothetical protein JW841_08085 [Deltaproteobacteria bacterium]|nr:hypothetical protein [Deltaproteobacteria bacterium]